MAPDQLQRESDVGSMVSETTEAPSSATVVGAGLPLLAAGLALLTGLSTEVTPGGSWGWDQTALAVLAAVGVGVVAGFLLFTMFRAWRRDKPVWFRLFLLLGIATIYLLSAAASFILSVTISITRDPPEC